MPNSTKYEKVYVANSKLIKQSKKAAYRGHKSATASVFIMKLQYENFNGGPMSFWESLTSFQQSNILAAVESLLAMDKDVIKALGDDDALEQILGAPVDIEYSLRWSQ